MLFTSMCLSNSTFVCLVRRQPHGFLTLSIERRLLLEKAVVCGICLGELKWAVHLYDVSFLCAHPDSLAV